MDGTHFGRYRLVALLGRGGMGEVWRAYDTATGRVVAVKLLPPQLAQDQLFEQRFRREAHAAASLNEPHIVPIHDFGEIDGRLYVDMRLIEGRELGAVLSGERWLSPVRAVSVVEQVAAALNAAHRVGLVHRDVKPSNILLAENDFAYLIDFGIARAAHETGLTQTGSAIGTLAYMAPERFSGQVDPRSDIYALGCVLHECLTGRRPFPGEAAEELLAGHLTAPPPRPSTIRPDVPPAFDAVIARSMAKEPQQRYRTALELADAARAALVAGGPIASADPARRTDGPSDQQSTSWWRRRTIAIMAVVAVIAVATSVVILLVVDHQREEALSASAAAASSSAAASASAATSSIWQHQRSQLQTEQAVHSACDSLATNSENAVDAVNKYVDASNNGGDIAGTKGPAIDSLNHGANVVAGSVTDALPPEIRDAINAWVKAARGAANTISLHAGWSEFNRAIAPVNDTRNKALKQCDAFH